MFRVQKEDFVVQDEYDALCHGNEEDGAVVFFVGKVRNSSGSGPVKSMYLEHYPAMTDKVLSRLVKYTRNRWELGNIRIVHRIGELKVGEQIVFVGVTSKHRQQAFEAAQYLMDTLKVSAPFWKKERFESGEQQWVEAKKTDTCRAEKWFKE